ncbi:hypothetical protein [Streptomyces vinaceus]|uniref:hypothetical protein n=1 Tax=Streptomyces vinaceus TaxID=1960 RepID=UPI00369F83D3
MTDAVIDIVERNRAVGHVAERHDDSGDWSIYGTKEGRVWTVYADFNGDGRYVEATGSTPAVALKRWCQAYGIPHGSAEVASDLTGRLEMVRW